jgi:hypothetical protein
MRSDYEYDLLARHDELDLLNIRSQAETLGINVDDALWDQLKEFAKLTLVAANVSSRSGAGPAD